MTSQWPRASLGDLLRLERRPVKVEPNLQYQEIGIYCFGRGIFLKTPRSGLEVGDKALYLLREGDFILQVTFAWEGAVALVTVAEDGLYGSTRYPTFRVDDRRCLPEYLVSYFRTEAGLRQLASISPGSAGRNRVLSIKRVPEVKIPLPPLSEQRRIVERFEVVAERVAEALEVRRQASASTLALVKAALHRLSADAVPTGRLGDVLATPPRNGWSARCDNEPDGTPVLSLGAVTGFRYKSHAFKRTSLPLSTAAHCWLSPGDLLITRSNTPDLVGHVAIYDGHPHPCIYPDLMMRLDIKDVAADRRFVWYWLQSPIARTFIISAAKGTSPTMKKISQSTVLAIPFPTSLSLSRQRQTVAALDALSTRVASLERIQADTSTMIASILPAVLDRAIQGRP